MLSKRGTEPIACRIQIITNITLTTVGAINARMKYVGILK